MTATQTIKPADEGHEQAANGEPLRGVRVIEFGQLLAGPYVGTLLGDFGAEVIKVEPPPHGDAMRDWGRLRHNGHSLWWSVLSRNKQSVTIDLRTDEGQAIAARLCDSADVLVENFRPGTMERWGLGPDAIHARNPRCVYARVSGYGQTGRYANLPGFASAGEAIGGLRYINGYPGQAPPRSGISLGDTLAAQSAFQGILLALYARDTRGAAGQVVDASIADACFAMLESAIVEYEKTGFVREPTGPRLPRVAPSNVYRTGDGRWMVIAANHDTLWRRLAALMGRPELADDPKFRDHHARGEHEDELDEMIGAWAARYPADELRRMLDEAGVVCAPVYSVADIYNDPHFRERGLLVAHHDDVHGEMTVPGVIPKLTGTPGSIRRSAPWHVGQDTDRVLRGLGFGDEDLERLERERVIVRGRPQDG
ncbi:MAG TPA: CoA transferase [Solirubrobacteraceae bacterium]|nr:CoA transferase [Solirubrobacteraceae bacterium]